jgi:phosphate acetyltransferase
LHKIVEPFVTRAAARKSAIVFPEGEDARILEAAARLRDGRLASRYCLPVSRIACLPQQHRGRRQPGRHRPSSIPRRPGCASRCVEAMLARKPNLDAERLEAMARDPLVFGGVLVAIGRADAMIAGAVAETGRVISASLRTIGLVEGMNRLSSYFLMSVPNHRGQGRKDFLFADCAVNIDPDADELAEIAIATMATAGRLLDEPPKGALLSFSTKGSASHSNVTKVTEALSVIRKVAPDLAIEGELQVDAALCASGRRAQGQGWGGRGRRCKRADLPRSQLGQYRLQACAIHGQRRCHRPIFSGLRQAGLRPVARLFGR